METSTNYLESRSVLISKEARDIFLWIVCTFSFGIVACFGTVTNTINIICFVKQGLKDPVNISLLGLAISDLGCLVPLLWSPICYNPAFQNLDLPFDSFDFQYLTSGWPHVIFTRITSWITALVALERCLCIIMPLKIKSIMTAKRTTIIIVCLFFVSIFSFSPMYYANRLGLKFSPERNKTLIGLVNTEDRAEVEEITFAINNLFIPFAAFSMVIICTVTLVVKLRNKSKWRMKCTAKSNLGAASKRDQKVAKMVVMISVLFIASFIPICFIILAMIFEPRLALDGQYRNTLFVVSSIGVFLEAMNSSSNIFIYYHMSSKYKCVFRQLFGLIKKQ